MLGVAGQQSQSVGQDRQQSGQIFDRPLGTSRQIYDQRPSICAGRRPRQCCQGVHPDPLGEHQDYQSRCLTVEHRPGRFRSHVSRSESRPSGGDPQDGLTREIPDSLAYLWTLVGDDVASYDGVALAFQEVEQGCPGKILAVTVGNSVRDREDRGRMAVNGFRLCQIPLKIGRPPTVESRLRPVGIRFSMVPRAVLSCQALGAAGLATIGGGYERLDSALLHPANDSIVGIHEMPEGSAFGLVNCMSLEPELLLRVFFGRDQENSIHMPISAR
jgi:hypothetical protein